MTGKGNHVGHGHLGGRYENKVERLNGETGELSKSLEASERTWGVQRAGLAISQKTSGHLGKTQQSEIKV